MILLAGAGPAATQSEGARLDIRGAGPHDWPCSPRAWPASPRGPSSRCVPWRSCMALRPAEPPSSPPNGGARHRQRAEPVDDPLLRRVQGRTARPDDRRLSDEQFAHVSDEEKQAVIRDFTERIRESGRPTRSASPSRLPRPSDRAVPPSQARTLRRRRRAPVPPSGTPPRRAPPRRRSPDPRRVSAAS